MTNLPDDDRTPEWYSPKRYFLDAPKEQPGTAFVLASDFVRLQGEVNRLRRALRAYENCRHGCVNCNCTADARNAL